MTRFLTQRFETATSLLAAICLLAPMLIGSVMFMTTSI